MPHTACRSNATRAREDWTRFITKCVRHSVKPQSTFPTLVLRRKVQELQAIFPSRAIQCRGPLGQLKAHANLHNHRFPCAENAQGNPMTSRTGAQSRRPDALQLFERQIASTLLARVARPLPDPASGTGKSARAGNVTKTTNNHKTAMNETVKPATTTPPSPCGTTAAGAAVEPATLPTAAAAPKPVQPLPATPAATATKPATPPPVAAAPKPAQPSPTSPATAAAKPASAGKAWRKGAGRGH